MPHVVENVRREGEKLVFEVQTGDTRIRMVGARIVEDRDARNFTKTAWVADEVIGLEGPPKGKPAPPCFRLILSEDELPEELRPVLRGHMMERLGRR